MFLREFVPQTLRDAWRTEFEKLRQGTMTVLEYAIRFSELSCHVPTLVPTVRERVQRFSEGLSYDLRFCMTRELQTDTPYQEVVEIARMLECIRGEEREDKETKRSRGSGGFSGFYSSAMIYHGRGSGSRQSSPHFRLLVVLQLARVLMWDSHPLVHHRYGVPTSVIPLIRHGLSTSSHARRKVVMSVVILGTS
nr:uncharacterized protein LOC117281250 isoform X1 [Nicotiana tomentosiformis]